MNYEQAFNILDLRSLNDFVYQPVAEGVLVIEPDPLSQVFISLEEDPWKYWGLNFDWTNPFGITDKINTLIRNIQDIWRKICDIFHYVWNAISMGWKSWWEEIWEAIRRMYYNFTAAFFEFTRDPWGYLERALKDPIIAAIKGIKTITFGLWDIISGVYNKIYSWLEPRLTSIKDVVVNFIKYYIEDLRESFVGIYNWIKDTLVKMWEGVLFIKENFPIGLRGMSDELSSKLDAMQAAIVRSFDLGLGGLVKAIIDFFGGIWDQIWEWSKSLISKVLGFLKNEFFIPLWEGVKGAWEWLKNIFHSLLRSAIDLMKKLAPSAPERGEELVDSAMKLLGVGVGAFGAFTGVSMLVSWLSKHHLGHLSAILYDMSSYKYIAGALIGGLTTAAFAIPLKYYYNSLFRPNLPKWEYILDLYNRGIIKEDELREFAKWYGYPDKYVWHFIRYVATPISLFRQPDMAVWDTSNKGELIEEMRFSGLEEAGVVQYMPALWMKAKSIWLTRMITEMMYNIRRGFALVPEMVEDIKKLVTGTETVTSSGHRFLPRVTWTFKKMPTTSEILDKISKWATKRLSSDGLVDEVKAEFKEDLITADEARTRLSEIIKIPELVEGELAPLIARKKRRVEPEKGKDLRKELKTVLTRCYKEGFVTHAELQRQIELSNQTVDEPTLIKTRAHWEAYYDDMMDWRKIYERSLADGIITEAQFKRDLLDLGFRESKVELLIKYDRAKKLGRATK